MAFPHAIAMLRAEWLLLDISNRIFSLEFCSFALVKMGFEF